MRSELIVYDPYPLLLDRDFWLYYFHQTDKPLDGPILEHFETVEGRKTTRKRAMFQLPCGSEHVITLEVDPFYYGVQLDLLRFHDQQKREMGWWDDARWHPFALRWEELEKLHVQWLEIELPCDTSAAFLLLAIFVGHGVSERKELKQRQATVRGHLVRLGLFSEPEIDNLSKRLVIAPPDDDYDWTWDDELGWCYGGDYPCYSLISCGRAES